MANNLVGGIIHFHIEGFHILSIVAHIQHGDHVSGVIHIVCITAIEVGVALHTGHPGILVVGVSSSISVQGLDLGVVTVVQLSGSGMAEHEVHVVVAAVGLNAVADHDFSVSVNVAGVNVVPLAVNLNSIPEMVGVEAFLSLTVHGDVGIEGDTDTVNNVVLGDVQSVSVIVVQILSGLPVGSGVDASAVGVDIGLQALNQVSECLGVAQADSGATAQSAKEGTLPVIQNALGQADSSLVSEDSDCLVGSHVRAVGQLQHGILLRSIHLQSQDNSHHHAAFGVGGGRTVNAHLGQFVIDDSLCLISAFLTESSNTVSVGISRDRCSISFHLSSSILLSGSLIHALLHHALEVELLDDGGPHLSGEHSDHAGDAVCFPVSPGLVPHSSELCGSLSAEGILNECNGISIDRSLVLSHLTCNLLVNNSLCLISAFLTELLNAVSVGISGDCLSVSLNNSLSLSSSGSLVQALLHHALDVELLDNSIPDTAGESSFDCSNIELLLHLSLQAIVDILLEGSTNLLLIITVDSIVNHIVVLMLLGGGSHHGLLALFLITVHDIGHVEDNILCQPVVDDHVLLGISLSTGVLDQVQDLVTSALDGLAIDLNTNRIGVQEVLDHTGDFVIGDVTTADSVQRNVSQDQHFTQDAQIVLAVVVRQEEGSLHTQQVGICCPVVQILLIQGQNFFLLLRGQGNSLALSIQDLDRIQFGFESDDGGVFLVNLNIFAGHQKHVGKIEIKFDINSFQCVLVHRNFYIQFLGHFFSLHCDSIGLSCSSGQCQAEQHGQRQHQAEETLDILCHFSLLPFGRI